MIFESPKKNLSEETFYAQGAVSNNNISNNVRVEPPSNGRIESLPQVFPNVPIHDRENRRVFVEGVGDVAYINVTLNRAELKFVGRYRSDGTANNSPVFVGSRGGLFYINSNNNQTFENALKISI